jgi:LacI family transcriptional regulator
MVARLKLPVVDVSATGALPNVPWVETHDESIAQLAIDHFRQRGFRHFAFCGDDRFAWSRYRREGMQRLLENSSQTCHVFGSPAARSLNDDEQELTEWILKLPKPVGILSCYDLRGRQLIEICQRNQIAVPEQVAVLGVDNDELVCNLSEIPLSSVIPNASGAGYLAAKLLSQMLAGETVDATAHLLKPMGIVTRQSTDSLAIDDAVVIQAMQFIREHACSGIKVEDLLRTTKLTRRVLESRFKKYLGHSPHDAIQNVRLRRAEELLIETDLPLAIVADRSGFLHTEYFSVVFKRWKGVSPSQYRQSHGV